MTCEIRLLGGFGVQVDGTAIDGTWARRRAAELVKILALQESRRLHREQIMDALWPHLTPEAARANLRKAVHFARRALGSEDTIQVSAGMIELWPEEEVVVDVALFENSARAALARDDREALIAAAALYAGELLPEDRYAPWAFEPRERLRALAVRVFKAASLWERVLDLDPADEEAHRALMEQALASGDRVGAIRQFQQLRQRLRIDLGLGPDIASVALYEKALNQEGVPASAAERAWALLSWGLVHMRAGDLDQAEQSGTQARGLALNSSLTQEIGEASALLGIVANARGQWRDLFLAEFVDAVERSPEIAASVFDAHLCIAEFCLYGLSSRDEIVAYARRLLDVADESGSLHGRALAELLLGEADLLSGDMEEAREHLMASARLHHHVGAVGGHVMTLQRLADAAVASEEYERARRLLHEGIKRAEASSMEPHLTVRMHEQLVAAAPATAELREVEAGERALAGRVVCPPCSIGFRVAVAKAFARGGRVTFAQARLDDVEQLARMWPGGPWHAAVWEARAELRRAQGDEEAAAVMFREAARLFAAADRPRDEARCLARGLRPGLASLAR